MILVEWMAQSFIQLVLLPALMVGQNLQNIAADARSAKTFEDVERIIDLLDCPDPGGREGHPRGDRGLEAARSSPLRRDGQLS